MAARRTTLRGMVAAANAVVALIVLLVCGALVVTTAALHRVTDQLGNSVESVRVLSDAEIDLLLHSRARDPVVRAQTEANVQRRLVEARSHITTELESTLLARAEAALGEYLNTPVGHGDPQDRVDTAFAALDALVEMNVEQARDEQRQAALWDRRADAFAVTAASLVLLLSIGLVWWMRASVFGPVSALSSALGRFARGEHGARVRVSGPAELREMAYCFNEMADTIERQRQAQIAFLGGVAHDLRTPLSALSLSLASADCEPPPPGSRLARTLEMARRQVTRLDRMVGDFLDMGRIEAGQLELRLEKSDARTLVEQVVDLFENAWQDHPLELELPERPLLVRCDPLRIEQVITNLVSNALKYSPAGSAVSLTLAEREHHAVISVVDRGVGISEADAQRVFEPFRRVGLSKEAVPGVGLGLFVVQRIVQAHGGRVEVQSALGAGSTFRVWLPLAEAPARKAPALLRERSARLDAPRRDLR